MSKLLYKSENPSLLSIYSIGTSDDIYDNVLTAGWTTPGSHPGPDDFPSESTAAAEIIAEGDWGEGNGTVGGKSPEGTAAFSRSRERLLLLDHLSHRPDGITILLGPRDSGKSCLLRELVQSPGFCSLDLRYGRTGSALYAKILTVT